MKCYRVNQNLNDLEIQCLVDESEARFFAQLDGLCRALLQQKDLRMMGLTGPTCSGKTTAANMLTEAFESDGKQVHVISIDDFYFDKEYLEQMTKQKGLKILDYDSEETIDIQLLQECVDSLRMGKRTLLPRFNFHAGLREMGEAIIPNDKDLFLFEGIQVLYPKVDGILKDSAYQSIQISPQSSIEIGGQCFLPNEIRLMRRLVRDYHFRSTSPEFTLMLWKSVRENEELLIFPNIHRCDYSIDSTMAYEIGILKPYLEEILPTIPKENEFWDEANGILERISQVQALPAELIQNKSLYKEFI